MTPATTSIKTDAATGMERNARVQARYDELRREGKHGHYETMFRVVSEEVQSALSTTEQERDAALRLLNESLDALEVATVVHPVPSERHAEVSDAGKCSACEGMSELKRIREALATPPSSLIAGHGWKTIETAPKDGTHILAYRLPLGIRFTNNTNPPTVVHWFNDPDAPGFYTSVNEIAPELPFAATHWRELPAPPGATPLPARETDNKGFR